VPRAPQVRLDRQVPLDQAALVLADQLVPLVQLDRQVPLDQAALVLADQLVTLDPQGPQVLHQQ